MPNNHRTELSTKASGHPAAWAGVTDRVVTIAVLMALAIGAFLGMAMAWMHTEDREQALALGAAFAQVVEEQTSRTLQAVDLRLMLAADTLMHAEEHGKVGPKATQVVLAGSLRDLPFVRAIWIMDARGIVTVRSDQGPLGLDFSDRPFFRHLQGGMHRDLYLGEPVRSQIDGKWLIHAARPLFSSQGAFVGVVVAGLEPRYFEAKWKEVALQHDGSVALWRSDARLMVRSPLREELLGQDYSKLPLFLPPLSNQPVGAFEHHGIEQGDSRLLHFRRIAGFPNLLIVVGQSHRAIFAHWRQMTSLVALLWALGSVVLVVFARSLQRTALQSLHSRQQREQVFERIPDAFVAVDRQWRYTYVNAQATDVMGRSRTDLLGMSIWAPALRNDNPGFRQACEKALSDQEPVHIEVQFAPSGRWYINHIYPSQDGLTIYFRETTAEKEHALQLHTLSRRVLEVQEFERRRIAHELHDELGQSLTAIKINLQTSTAFGDDLSESRMPRNIEMIESALQHVRNLSQALRPSVLDDLGLRAALEWLVETAASTSRLDMQFTSNLDDRRLDSALETACFRIVQEALTNIQRHAQASQVQVALTAGASHLRLTVQDDGKGFNVDSDRSQGARSLGMLGMRERAELVGGSLQIISGEGQGCTVRMECPLATVEEPT